MDQMKNFGATESIPFHSDPGYSLILMSESRRVLPHWIFEARGVHISPRMASDNVRISDFRYPEDYYDGDKLRESWMFNVLLVKRTGTFVERIAFGQVHMLAWLEMQRSRRYVRML
jgi:hypothetical protein